MSQEQNDTKEVEKIDNIPSDKAVDEEIVENDINEVLDEKKTNSVFQDLSVENFDKRVKEQRLKARRKKKKKNKQRSNTNMILDVLSIIRDLLVCFTIAALIGNFFVMPIRVDGISMYPTLHDNDIAFSSIINGNTDKIERFDIVVVYDESADKYVVKRIIGLPNETIQYSENVLYIDGIPYDEEFLDEEYCINTSLSINDYFTGDFDPVHIGENQYFIMGDNRPNSKDSRKYGVIDGENIRSKNVFVIYPFNRLGGK